MSVNLATQATSRTQTFAFAAIAMLLTVIAALSSVYADVPIGPQPAFLPFFGTVVCITDLLTAYLLVTQFRITRIPMLVVLASAYLYSGLIVVPHLLMFPGVVTDSGLFGAGRQSAIWMWVFWHTGFPVLIAVSMLVEWLQSQRGYLKAAANDAMSFFPLVTVGVVGGLTYIVTVHQGWLPSLVDDKGSFSTLSHSTVGITVQAVNAIAVVLVFAITRGKTVAHLGLLLSVTASLLDVVLTLHSEKRFSLGWYVARGDSMISAGSVLCFFLYELVWLYHRLADLNEKLNRLAFIDGLTGLANRRQFEERIKIEFQQAKKNGETLAVIMLDVDHFKKFNDIYGHRAGDNCLCQVARTIAGVVHRPADLVARFGGEEFIVVLPSATRESAHAQAEQIGEAIRRLALRHDGNEPLHMVTVSQGVAVMRPGRSDDWSDLVEAADSALYRAKRTGRNRVASAVPSMEPREDYPDLQTAGSDDDLERFTEAETQVPATIYAAELIDRVQAAFGDAPNQKVSRY